MITDTTNTDAEITVENESTALGSGVNVTDSFRVFAETIHQTAVEHGWWEKQRSIAECVELIHCELSEASEGYREHNPPSVKAVGFTQIEEELGDVLIRLLDMAYGHGWSNWNAVDNILGTSIGGMNDDGVMWSGDMAQDFALIGGILIENATTVTSYLEDTKAMRDLIAFAENDLNALVFTCLLSLAGISVKHNHRVIEAAICKAEYNKSRPYRHGNKVA